MTAQVRYYPVARVVDVHDGDTLRLDVDLGFSTHAYVWIRLKGVRAPELREPTGPQAKRDLETWISTHAPDGLVRVDTFQVAGSAKEIREQRTFIRYVGVISAPDGSELYPWMVARGYVDQGA
jgi:endonuclease YncB( thermonuclease family)